MESVIKQRKEILTSESLSSENLTVELYDTFKEVTTYSQNIPKHWTERNTIELFLWGWHHSQTKTRWETQEKGKLKSIIIDEHRCTIMQKKKKKKNCIQQCIHINRITCHDCVIYYRDVRVIQHIQIKCLQSKTGNHSHPEMIWGAQNIPQPALLKLMIL